VLRLTPNSLSQEALNQLSRIRMVGYGISGNRQQRRYSGIGYDRPNLAIDDATHLAYVDVSQTSNSSLPSAFCAMLWLGFTAGRGVPAVHVGCRLPACLSRSFSQACELLGLKHICSRPYALRTNGRGERFIQTLCKEWALGDLLL
jgi:hypothetical protein